MEDMPCSVERDGVQWSETMCNGARRCAVEQNNLEQNNYINIKLTYFSKEESYVIRCLSVYQY